jgi:hypothetical protein
MHIAIQQIYFAEEQKETLEPAFTPLPNLDNPYPERREFFLYERFYQNKTHKLADLSGLVSHKFRQKTNLSGEAFVDWINANPGYDAYFINPFPETVYWFFNIWEQGEKSHHGIMALAQEAFDTLGYPIKLKSFPRTDAQTTCFSNFWVATPKFWEDYMAFALPVYHYMLEPSRAARFFQNTYHDSNAEIFPFIIERLFTTFIVTRPDYKVLGFPQPQGWAKKTTKRLVPIINAVDHIKWLKNSTPFRIAMELLSVATYTKNRTRLFGGQHIPNK